jgi:hypothetical protein
MNLYNPTSKVESFRHFEETNTIEVVFRESSDIFFTTNPPRPAPDRVWKEVYSVVDGVITLTETIEGTHTPSHYVEESITFNTKEK